MVCFTKWPRINILDKVAGVGASYRFKHRKHYKLKPSQSLWRLSSKLKAPRAHCGPCGAVQDKDGGTPPHVQLPKKGGNLEAQLQPHLGEGGQVNNWSLMSSPNGIFAISLPSSAALAPSSSPGLSPWSWWVWQSWWQTGQWRQFNMFSSDVVHIIQ